MDLAVLREQQGRADEAIEMLRTRADAGNGDATIMLGALMAGKSPAAATEMLRSRALAGDRPAAEWVVGILEGKGRADEAIEVMRVCADADYGPQR